MIYLLVSKSRGKMPASPQGDQVMNGWQQLWHGISPCMEPGVRGCVVWWDAWAAIGTVLAVFTAIFGPSIQRRFFLRKKANAVFAAAYRSDALMARIFLDGLIDKYPMSAYAKGAGHAGDPLQDSKEERERFEQYTAKLSCLADREVDGSKWPAADLDLILAVVHAVQSAKEVIRVGNQMNSDEAHQRDWATMGPIFKTNLSNAKEDIDFADRRLAQATQYPAAKDKVMRETWKRLRTWWRELLGLRAG